MTQKPPSMDKELSAMLEELPECQKRQRAKELSDLQEEPASYRLRSYFARLEEGSPKWDMETCVEAALLFANVCGPERTTYYDKPLKGIHYPNDFATLWNQTYPHQPFKFSEQNFRRQCPPSWSYDLDSQSSEWKLTYQGDMLVPQGINDLIKGPTTLDCGMFTQLEFWMIIRYLAGDEMFKASFNFKKGAFFLTGNSYDPVNGRNPHGNLLFPFFDSLDDLREGQPAEYSTRIQIKTVFSHPSYLCRHPGGQANLQNCMKIDGRYIILDPSGSQTTLSTTELDRQLLQSFNAPRDYFDLERLFIWTQLPNFIHPHYAPRTFASLVIEAEEFEGRTMSNSEWDGSRFDREELAHGFNHVFNLGRLVTCLRETRDDCINGITGGDILSKAWRKKLLSLANP